MNIDRIHIFHRDCPSGSLDSRPGTARPKRFICRADKMNTAVMSQAYLYCEGCGTRLHVDIWPMQIVPEDTFSTLSGTDSANPQKDKQP